MCTPESGQPRVWLPANAVEPSVESRLIDAGPPSCTDPSSVSPRAGVFAAEVGSAIAIAATNRIVLDSSDRLPAHDMPRFRCQQAGPKPQLRFRPGGFTTSPVAPGGRIASAGEGRAQCVSDGRIQPAGFED